MKILNIILTSQNGGAEQVFIDYSAILKKLGHEVYAVVKPDAPYSDELSKIGIEAKKIPNHFGYYDFFAVKKLQKILQENQIQTVFAHAGRAIVIARKAIKKIKDRKIFLVAVNHSMNVKRSIGADIVLSVNNPIFYKTIDCGQKEDRSFVIPNAVDLTDAIEDAPKINLQQKDKIIIGAIGRLDKSKGFRFAINAIKKLEAISDKKFYLKLAGSGPREPYLRALVKELNLEDRVEFCGWVRDKKAFFNSIDIFTLTSERETFGLVLLEAMKYRKPIIATNSDGPKEILRDGIDAIIVAFDATNDDAVSNHFCEAIARIVNEPDLANKMVENSFLRLKEKFSLMALEQRLSEVVGAIPSLRR